MNIPLPYTALSIGDGNDEDADRKNIFRTEVCPSSVLYLTKVLDNKNIYYVVAPPDSSNLVRLWKGSCTSLYLKKRQNNRLGKFLLHSNWSN